MGGGCGRSAAGVAVAAAVTAAVLGACRPPTHGPTPATRPHPVVDPRAEPGVLPPPPAATAPAAKPSPARPKATGSRRLITNYDGQLDVPTGQSIILRLSAPAERVAIADPEVAEVVLINPQEVLINGKGKKTTVERSNALFGTTTKEEVLEEAKTSIIVWDKAGHSDTRTLYINKARTDQIMMEVVVADLNRSAMETEGVDFQFLQGDVFLHGSNAKLVTFKDGKVVPVLNNPTIPRPIGEELQVPGDLTYLLWDTKNDFLAFVQLLQQENLAKILARPTILARSGEEAHFRVGGEVPVVYATTNVATVNFKEFGVLLTVTPTIDDDGTIDMRISTEVSQPSNVFASTVNGFTIPSFVSRKAETRVRLKELETLMIGGLYREDETEQEEKTPYLGDVPYLGALFRKTHYDKTKNELVILVKPRIARKPSDVTPVGLPTDRPPLTRDEVRTQADPHEVSRPRLPLEEPVTPRETAPDADGGAGREPSPPPGDAGVVPPH